MKLCARCRLSKPEDAFSVDRRRPDGRYSYCKVCHAERYAENPGPTKARASRWAKANPDKRAIYCRKTQLRKYGLTLEAFADLLTSQDGRCAICGSAESGAQGWHVDHEHVDGWDAMSPDARRLHVRGILCHLCNVGLGSFRDSPEALDAAAAYLRTRLEKLGA